MDAGETVIIDYGMGNLRSVENALRAVGGSPVIRRDPEFVRSAARCILPGVGAFGDAMANLRRSGMDRAIGDAARSGTPVLGLCLGLQLLFSSSEEFGLHEGLGLIPGRVRRFDLPGLRVPHVGWNQVESLQADPLLSGTPEGAYFYFIHSYYVEPESDSDVLAWTDYGCRFCSIARRGSVWGAQFHPEKSQEAGRRLLQNFLSLAGIGAYGVPA
ncbi:MAG: imidazole glycerol phosphate synthase subunit HisH [Acidobacteriota bacterium]